MKPPGPTTALDPDGAATSPEATRSHADRHARSDHADGKTCSTGHEAPQLSELGDPQWKALASPIRVELLLLAGAIEPCSISDLARLSGRRSTGLYRHVAILAEADLLLPRGKRPGPRRPEQLYVLNRHFASLRDRCGSSTDRFRRLQEAVWRSIDRGLSDRLDREGEATGAPASCEALHEVTWLDESRRGEATRLLGRLRELAEEGRRERNGELCQLDLVLWRRPQGDGGD